MYVMAGYTKLFSSILDSTIWQQPPHVKIVWITMLAMKDQDGIVEASVPGLAIRAGVDRSQCEQALAILMAPDPDSRSEEREGRRIEKVPGGWRLINHFYYQQKLDTVERLEKGAERQRRYRERQASRVTSSDGSDAGRSLSTEVTDQMQMQRQMQAEDQKKISETLSATALESALTRNNPKPAPKSPHAELASELCRTFKRLTGRAWTSEDDLLEALDGRGALTRSPMPEQVRAMAAHLSEQPEPIQAARRAMEGWAADPWVKANRFPMAHLVKDPLKYLSKPIATSASVPSDFSHVDPNEPLPEF